MASSERHVTDPRAGTDVHHVYHATNTSGRILAAAVAIFVLAFTLRAVHVFSYDDHAFACFRTPTLDAHFYDCWAKRILAGEWIGDRVFQGVPLYPYVLAFVYKLFGTGPVPIALVQSAFGALGVTLLYLFTRMAFSEGVALLTAGLASFYPTFILYESLRLGDGLATFFASAVLLASCLFLRRPTVFRAAGTGLLLGLAVLSRERFLLFAPLLLVWSAWSRRGLAPVAQTLRAGGIFLAALVAPLSLSLAHNVAAADDWVLLSSLGGVNFYIGNQPDATGRFDVPRGLSKARRELYVRAKVLAEEAEGRPLKASEVSSHWTKRGLEFWSHTPMDALQLCFRKLLLFWKGYEFPDVVDPAYARSRSAVLSLPLPGFRVLGPLALVGLVVSWLLARRDPRGIGILYSFLAANLVFMMIFFVSSRFRMSAIPSVLPFSAAAIVWFAGCVSVRRFTALAVGGAGLALATLFVNVDPEITEKALRESEAIRRFNSGQALYRKKRYLEAETAFRAAVSLDEEYAKAWYYLASTLKLTRHREEAYALFQRALKLDPHFGRGRTFYAALLLDMNRPERAIPELEQALRDDPELGIAAVGLGIAYNMLGEREAAIRYFRRAVEIDPTRAEDVNRRLGMMGVK